MLEAEDVRRGSRQGLAAGWGVAGAAWRCCDSMSTPMQSASARSRHCMPKPAPSLRCLLSLRSHPNILTRFMWKANMMLQPVKVED
jgi:hypothetical protein